MRCLNFNHISHGSVSVVRTTFKVCGKRPNLTLSQPKTPKPIVTKFDWRDYVEDAYHQQSLGSFCQGFLLPTKVKYTLLECLAYHTFWCFYSHTGR